MILWSFIVAAIIVLDQIFKYWITNNIGLTDSLTVIPNVMDFVYVKNTGAAFSFLADRAYGIIILSIISILFCIFALWFMIKKKPKSKMLKIAIALMLSGALGNAIDRIFRGYVVDFIEATFINFPVFNIADIAITFGAALLIIFMIFFDREKSDEISEN